MSEFMTSIDIKKELKLEHYYYVFNSAFQSIAILDPNGILLDCNEVSLKIINQEKKEILGQYFWDTPWWDYTPSLSAKLKEHILLANKGESKRFEAVYIDLNDNKIYIDLSIKPAIDPDGNVKFIVIKSRNITNIKNAHATLNSSETKYKELFEKSGDASLIIVNGKFADYNKAALKMLQFVDNDKFLDSHPSDFSPEYQPDGSLSFLKSEEMMNQAEQNGTHRFEWIHKKNDGTLFPVEILLTSIGSQTRSFHVIMRDITERKLNENRIKHLNLELEAKVKQRTKQLEDSINELEFAQEELIESRKLASLGELVAGIAHEINTPIGNDITTTTYLNKVIENLNTEFKEGKLTKTTFKNQIEEIQLGTNAILKNLTWAANLVNSFKQLAVDQSSNLERDFNLFDILNELKISMRNVLQYHQHEIILSINDNLYLYGNPGTFTQIFQNLIQNSVHHGFDNINKGRIYVESNIKDNSLVITYTDNGKGISKSNIDKIYNPFFTTGRAKGRTGLGMSIVHNQISKLKGKISLIDHDSNGVEFKITIPLDSLKIHNSV